MLSEIYIKTNEKVWVETDIQNCYDQLRVSQVMNIAELLFIVSLLSQILTLIASY